MYTACSPKPFASSIVLTGSYLQNGPSSADSILRPLYLLVSSPSAVRESGARGRGPPRRRRYNVLGQRVRTLVARPLQPGTHALVWDARDDLGREVASGVYVVRMEAPGFQKAVRLTLAR